MESWLIFLLVGLLLFIAMLLCYLYLLNITKKVIIDKTVPTKGILAKHTFLSKLFTAFYTSWRNIDTETAKLKLLAILFIMLAALMLLAITGFVIELYYRFWL